MTGPQPPPLDILVVENQPDVAWSTAAVLTLYGHRVKVADDGPAALDAMADGPDVVLLDIGLPGMCGWELARRLRARSAGKPPLIVAVTGYGTDADRRRSAEAGIDLHLVKPVEPVMLADVLARFARVVGGGPGRAQTPARACSTPAISRYVADGPGGPSMLHRRVGIGDGDGRQPIRRAVAEPAGRAVRPDQVTSSPRSTGSTRSTSGLCRSGG